LALIERALDCTLRVRFENLVRDANPTAFRHCTERAICATPFASSDESDGYDTFASTTVVSARNRFVFNTLASCAIASSASFNASTACWPQRVVIFINVVGCGTRPPSGIRQNRCHLIESVTSRHSRLDRDRRRAARGVEERHEHDEEALVIQEPIDTLELDGHHQRLGRQ
jgi:hypothetical protein